MTAFHKNASDRYEAYKESLVKGETTINAGAVYPYDITKALRYGDKTVASEQWKALPNYLEKFEGRMLPVIDVSGSMSCPAGGSKTVDCMEVAIGLGLYISERATGVFNNTFVTFHSQPQILRMPTGMSLSDKVEAIRRSPWGGTTNLKATFELMLNAAVEYNVPQSEMPTHLLVLSDMEFDSADRGYRTNHEYMKELYLTQGYELPQIIYWNLNARNDNFPVRVNEVGACLVSGFSPSLLKSVTSGDTDPMQMMLSVVDKERYAL